MTTVVIVDDDALARRGIRAALEPEDDLTVVGEAADGVEAVTVARELDPDVVLMDVQMPRLDGVGATRAILRLDDPPKVLVLTAFNLTENVVAAIDAGASGFVLKDATRTQLVSAVRAVAAGDPVLDPRSIKTLLERVDAARRDEEQAKERLTGLTARERDVLALLADGQTNAKIAEALFVSQPTVKTIVSHILDELGVENRTQAAILAHRAGLDHA
ncbi:response regulator [Luteimicrobium sp. DT211]|uniref:response regulator n=1 Tax=Luteimicrobium sp. DT211 TaxID=3393412 RepID=UPI003CF1D6C0